jgi:TetR/AcrR family transcriptional repressor of nem operon
MGRPREFDTDDLLETVMCAFWENGLEGTTMRQLEATTGVKQVSLYNAFGNKEGLFLAALDRYSDLLTTFQDQHLDNRGLDGIANLVMSFTTPKTGFPNGHFGCLIVNTALVSQSAGPAVKARVKEFRAAMHGRIVAAFERAKSRNKLRPRLNLDQCADFVVSTMWGIFVTIRMADGDQTVGQPAAKALGNVLRDWSRSGTH